MDYAAWVQSALDFHAQLGKQAGEWEGPEAVALPPIDSAQIDAIDSKLRHKTPDPIRNFLTSASSGLTCRYVWDPESKQLKNALKQIFPYQNYIFGGPTICNVHDFHRLQDECVEAATETWIVDEPEDQEIWMNAFPLVRPNGDMVALDLRENLSNPPVINLCHDGESQIIAESFDQFLQHWATIGYVGPEIWLLNEFLDPETKLMAPNLNKAQQFRSLLTGNTN